MKTIKTMKKLLLLTITVIFCSNINAQKEIKQTSSIYLVGCAKIDGYPLDIKVYYKKLTKLSNGKTCSPALNDYITNESDYIGGVLKDEKTGKTTKIVSIKLDCSKPSFCFLVKGKDFDKSFTYVNGYILKETSSNTLFYTEGKGIWKISKKKM